MSERIAVYEALAGLLIYPSAGYHEKVRNCQKFLQPAFPDAARPFAAFADNVSGKSVTELEELFTGTFDLNPVCSLEVGWHLFGENYSRGDFLVFMRQKLRDLGLPESCELPDHLTHVLPVIARLETLHADELVGNYVLPALEKMLSALEGKENPFEDLLKTIHALVAAPHLAGVASGEGVFGPGPYAWQATESGGR